MSIRPLSPAQDAAVSGDITQPQYFIYVELDQPYYWSTAGDYYWDGKTWLAGGVALDAVEPGSASLRVENDDYRHTMLAIAGAYLHGDMRIYHAPRINPIPYVEPGYWADEYVAPVTMAEPVLIFSGIISSTPDVDFWLSVTGTKTAPRSYPQGRIRPPYANHLPADGYTVEFDGQVMIMESSR